MRSKRRKGYRVVPLTAGRRLVAAYAAVARQRNNVHTLLEVDISAPRRAMLEHRQRTGEGLSLTALVITCLARAVARHPQLNAFRRGGTLIQLEDITVATLVEREVAGEPVPAPLGLREADRKSYRQIHDEFRAAQQGGPDPLAGLLPWLRIVPGWLLRAGFRAAAQNVAVARRLGVVGVTATGMFGRGAMWALPLTWTTVGVTLGGTVPRPVDGAGGEVEWREHLCLNVSFNHEIVDGVPATRFLQTFCELLSGGEVVREALGPARGP